MATLRRSDDGVGDAVDDDGVGDAVDDDGGGVNAVTAGRRLLYKAFKKSATKRGSAANIAVK